jgi:transcriptional regulator with XRE-family HTH domain
VAKRKAAPAPSDVFRSRLVEARKALGYTQAGLAERLTEIGTPMHETAVARIESGKRRVTLDDVIAIAAAMDVSPLFLFSPLEHDARIRLAATIDCTAADLWAWVRGTQPLDAANARSYHYQSPGDVGGSAIVEDAQELADWLARAGITGKRDDNAE